MATLVMWFEVAIGEDWSRLRLCGLIIDEKMKLRPLRGGLQSCLRKSCRPVLIALFICSFGDVCIRFQV